MDTSSATHPSADLGRGTVSERHRSTEAPLAPLARAIVQAALPLGILADDLFHQWGPTGAALPAWVAVLTLTLLSLAWTAGRAVSREACCWLAAAMLFAAGAAWRDSDALQAFDFFATVGALGMAAVALNDVQAAVFARRLRDTVWAVAAMLRDAAAGILPLIFRDAYPPQNRDQARPLARRVIRGSAIALPLLLVFGSLLISADPIFASLVPSLDLETILSHSMLTGFFTWIVAGWARRALLDRPAAVAPSGFPISLDEHDVTMALGTVLGLFALFMLVQLGWIFGGESFLRARTGLTVAGYARTGFFQLVWVALLVVPLLLATRAALRPEGDAVRRHTLLALPIVALVGTIMVSAAMRLRLYVHYYALTTDRLFALVFLGWLGVVLLWLAWTVLRGKGRPFVAGTALSGLVTLAGLNVANPDAIVATVNVARAGQALRTADDSGRVQPPVDLEYLARLSGDAASLAVAATLAPPRGREGTALRDAEDRDRCGAAQSLLSQWGPPSRRARQSDEPGSWRRASLGERAGRNAVSAHVGALLAVEHAACAVVRAQDAAARAKSAAASATKPTQPEPQR